MRATLERLSVKALSPHVCELVFDAACAVWIVTRVLLMSYLGEALLDPQLFATKNIYNWISYAVFYCEFARVLRAERRRWYDVVAIWIVVAMWWGAHQLGAFHIMVVVLLIYCARSFDVRNTIRRMAIVLGVTLLIVLASAAFGIVEDTIIYQYARVRHCTGFTYALFGQQLLFALTCAACGLRGKNLTVIEAVILAGTNIMMYQLSNSRLSCGMALLLIVATLCLKIKTITTHRGARWIWRALTWAFVAVFVFSVALVFAYGVCKESHPSFAYRLNAAFGARPSFSLKAFELYPVMPFGQRIRFIGNGLNAYGNIARTTEYFYVDMLFIRALLERGWIYTLALVSLYTVACRKLLQKGQYGLVLAMAATAAHCLLDDLAMDPSCNLMILALGLALTRDGKCVEVAPDRRQAIVYSSIGVAVSMFTALFFLGVVGSKPIDASFVENVPQIKEDGGPTMFSISQGQGGDYSIRYRDYHMTGKIVPTSSDNKVASFEVWDSDRHYLMTFVVPRDLSSNAYNGIWKVYYAKDGKENQYSDYWNLGDNGVARIMSGKFNVLSRSNQSLYDGGTEVLWSQRDQVVELGAATEASRY